MRKATGDMVCEAVSIGYDGTEFECRYDNLTLNVYVTYTGEVRVLDARRVWDESAPWPMYVDAHFSVPVRLMKKHEKLVDTLCKGDDKKDRATMRHMDLDIACWLESKQGQLRKYAYLSAPEEKPQNA